MRLDLSTLRSLEIERTSRSGEIAGSLLSVFPHCRTAMGRRSLRRRLCWPLLDAEEIRIRHRAVGGLIEDRDAAEHVRQAITGVNDVARIAGRIAVGRATPRDVVALGRSVIAAGPAGRSARRLVPPSPPPTNNSTPPSPDCSPLAERIDQTCHRRRPDPSSRRRASSATALTPNSTTARGLERDATEWLAVYQAKIVEETGIGALKVGFNRVFGYYIEVSKANDAKVPANFVRKQTLKNAERYITDELKTFEDKVLTAGARAIEREKRIFAELCLAISEAVEPIAAFGDAIAEIDCTACLAETAYRLGWVRPEMDDSAVLELTDARHPVLDASMRDRFVPNDCRLGTTDQSSTLALITGPTWRARAPTSGRPPWWSCSPSPVRSCPPPAPASAWSIASSLGSGPATNCTPVARPSWSR